MLILKNRGQVFKIYWWGFFKIWELFLWLGLYFFTFWSRGFFSITPLFKIRIFKVWGLSYFFQLFFIRLFKIDHTKPFITTFYFSLSLIKNLKDTHPHRSIKTHDNTFSQTKPIKHSHPPLSHKLYKNKEYIYI